MTMYSFSSTGAWTIGPSPATEQMTKHCHDENYYCISKNRGGGNIVSIHGFDGGLISSRVLLEPPQAQYHWIFYNDESITQELLEFVDLHQDLIPHGEQLRDQILENM